MMRFTKMQALGNDYIYIDAINQTIDDPSGLSVKMSARHYGVGSDGIVLICPSDKADFRMRMFNPDGTEAEICGNAIRSVAKYVYDFRLTEKTDVYVETIAGIRRILIEAKDGKAVMMDADMGIPGLEAATCHLDWDGERFINRPLEVSDRTFFVSAISIGNPHAVAYVFDVESFDLEKYGKAMEYHPIFKQKTNVEFAELIDRTHIRMRAWERGTGETLACGTGCCASVITGVLTDKCDRTVTVTQPGGDLYINWDAKSGHIFLKGPSTWVFNGEI